MLLDYGYRTTNIWPVVKVTADPGRQLPVSIGEAKKACDYEGDDRNDQFDSWVKTATAAVERDCERALITQTAKAYASRFVDEFRLAWPPVTAITGITYVDVNGVTQTLSSSVYQSDLISTPPAIYLAYGQSWETVRDETVNAVIVTFTAGYGGPDSVPDLLKEAIRIRVKRLYEGCSGDMSEDLPYQGCISTYRWRLA